MIDVINLKKSFGSVEVLKGINMTINKGDIVAVLLSCIIHFVPVFSFITDGFSIIICAVAASAVGALLYPVSEEEEAEHAA